MSRNICIYLEFLTPEYKERIRAAAEQAGFTPYFFTPDQLEAAKACAKDCEILYAHSPELLRAAGTSLKWYCCAFAGVDPYCKDDGIFANPDCLLSNSAGAYGVTIAEHVVMVALMLLRRMPEYMDIVRRRGWENQLPVRSIRGSTCTILGAGNIGSTVAERMRALGAARVTGLSRSGRARSQAFDESLPVSSLDQVLPRTEILVMAMPATAETAGILSRHRIALLPEDAIVINVGRGSAVDQTALMEALNSGKLAGAALDVMEPEPLPQDHPLWDTPNLILTPHVSGNMTLGYTCERNVELFCEDLARYAAGLLPLRLVDRSRGY